MSGPRKVLMRAAMVATALLGLPGVAVAAPTALQALYHADSTALAKTACSGFTSSGYCE
jgi:hypothetical protein